MPILMYKGQNLSGSGKAMAGSLDDASDNMVATAKMTNELNEKKASLESPSFTGTPIAPTATKGTDSDQIATTKFVQTEVTDVKKSVSDGKKLVADAITAKGIETATDATFTIMAENISNIETGVELHGAIISVTTDEETLIGMDVILMKDNTIIETKVFDNNGTCSFIIQESGDYTISSSDGTYSVSESVTITNDDIVNKIAFPIDIIILLNGDTVLPINDVRIWLKCGQVKGKGYTTIEEIMADTDTLFLLMSDENAMKYLTRSTGFADAGCANETFMTYLGQSAYVHNTVLNIDLWKTAIKQSPYKNKVLKQAELVVGNTYKFGGYTWVVAEKSDVSGYAVLQSTGLAAGGWPGYSMSGTLTNAAGSTITLTGANTYYTGNIDGYDISNYNSTTRSFYSSIKAAEYTAATYGKGLYLVSKSKAGSTSNELQQGSGYYCSALVTAGCNWGVFGAGYGASWLGTAYSRNGAWHVIASGEVYWNYGQNFNCVLAPAFNLDTYLVKVSGDEIILL